jgi:Domain of unknown function (DUF4386)
MNRNWIAPLCGVLFVVLVIVTFALTGEGQDPSDKSAQEIVEHWQDNDSKNQVGAFIFGLSGIVLLFFAGWIRQLLRRFDPNGMLPPVAFGALVLLAAGIGVGATIHLALVDYVNDVDPVVTNTLNVIDYDFFIPFAMGMSAFLLALGISVVQNGALPKWIGWVAIVLGIASFTPAGFFAFLAGLVLIVIIGIIGVMRSREAAAPATP